MEEVGLPAPIQRQLDQAAELERQLAGEVATPEAGNTVPELESPVTATPAEQPVVDLQTPPPVQQPVVSEETWEQKFHVLRGKYEAEVPRLHRQVNELSQQITDLVAKASAAPVTPEPTEELLVSKADEETFGADLLDAMRRVAREETSKVAKVVDQKVDEKVNPVRDRVAQDAATKFWGAVDSAVPDFEVVNQDPRWFQYLDSRIPGTRNTYRSAATAAVESHDAGALVEIITNWKALVTPKAVDASTPAPSRAQAELQRQVAPSTNKTNTPTETQTGRIWSGAEYAAALDPRNLQRLSSSEYADQIAEAEQALAEGRVQW